MQFAHTYPDANADSYCYIYTNPDAYGHQDPDTDRDSHANADTDRDLHPDAYCHADKNRDSHAQTADGHKHPYADAQTADANTHANTSDSHKHAYSYPCLRGQYNQDASGRYEYVPGMGNEWLERSVPASGERRVVQGYTFLA